MITAYHTPVLASESVELLAVNPNGVYVDLTFGGGGHSRLILERLGRRGRLYAFDQDSDAAANAGSIDDKRFTFITGNFRWMRTHLRMLGVERVDGIFADLGVSSHHFDTPERGFSFRFDGPLDMRMNARRGRTAADIVNGYSTDELRRVLVEWGELCAAGRIVSLIERARPIERIEQLVAAVEPMSRRKENRGMLPQLFQALRIEVNGEMEALAMALEQSLRVLAVGGRLVVISYHSLEDRAVKNFLRSGRVDGHQERDIIYGGTSSPFEILTGRAIVPTDAEVERNPRARSAKLRAGIKS